MPTPRNHYETLNVSPALFSGGTPSATVLKTAYRKALLRWHPDKTQSTPENPAKDGPSIDEITTAYNVLSSTRLRAEYEHELRHTHSRTANGNTDNEERNIGVEVLDLDDLKYDEELGIWTRECRCGTGGGFVVSEDDLEQAVSMPGSRMDGKSAEILVGCSGCSLCLRIGFAVAE